jgi:hypothetical protein
MARAAMVPGSRHEDPGGVFQLLREIKLGYKGPVFEVVEDRQAFERFFPEPMAGPQVSGVKYLQRPDDVVKDGSVLSFPDGVFRLRNLMHYRRWFPKDVTIRGAGMGRTLLYVDPVRSQEEVRNLRIEDCTVFASGRILNLANGPATLRCERVRFVGFDSASDDLPSWRRPAVVTTASAALHFIECRFEGGYGNNPSRGQLLDDTRSAVMARFDRCQISRLCINVGRRSTVVFDDCVLADLCEDPRSRPQSSIRFLNSRFENNWPASQRGRQLSLEWLFPDWRNRLVE